MIRVHAEHASSSLIQVAHHIAGEFVRNRYLQGFDRLKQYRAGFHEALLKCLARCRLECHLGGIYRMIRSIVKHCLHANNRISGQRPLHDRLLNTLLYCREVVLRNRTADYLL